MIKQMKSPTGSRIVAFYDRADCLLYNETSGFDEDDNPQIEQYEVADSRGENVIVCYVDEDGREWQWEDLIPVNEEEKA